jgi:hypothetical protein
MVKLSPQVLYEKCMYRIPGPRIREAVVHVLSFVTDFNISLTFN